MDIQMNLPLTAHNADNNNNIVENIIEVAHQHQPDVKKVISNIRTARIDHS